MPLSELQLRVARLVLALPQAESFALAGGAALIVHNVIDRVTNDLDCFGPSVVAVDELAPLAANALRHAGYHVDLVQHGPGFVRLRVTETDGHATQLDIGFDPAEHPAVASEIGAVRALHDLAGDKLLALFARAFARDFVDVAGLLKHFTSAELIALAASKDRGFSTQVLANAFGVLPSLRRERFDLSDDDYQELCETFAGWRAELEPDS